MLNGYRGYWPAGYAERMALARRLPDPAAVRELERTTGLRQIVVHTAGCRREERRVWIELADRGADATLALVARDGPDLLFDVARSPEVTVTIVWSASPRASSTSRKSPSTSSAWDLPLGQTIP